jgi:hypothetical protein
MITIILLVLAGLFKAIMDTLNFHYESSIFAKYDGKLGQWLNPEISWKNKYEWFPNSNIMTWLISGPLVFITDAWHFSQMLFLSCISLAISLKMVFIVFGHQLPIIGGFILIHSILTTSFEFFWLKFKKK